MPTRWRSFATNLILLSVVTTLTLVVIDIVLITTGLFPPVVDEGHPSVGWVGALPTGERVNALCIEPATGSIIRFPRNEDGVRTAHPRAAFIDGSVGLRVAVGGDSHTEVCAPNEEVHFGMTEAMLRSEGIAAGVYAFGAGKYSPLQAYLALVPTLDAYTPEVMILNVYTGNDFYDMLRIDDRPHFVATDTGYVIAPPVWYQSDPPGVRRVSRVLHVFRVLSDVTGARRVWVRVRYLQDVAREQGRGLRAVIGYMADLRKASVPEAGYPQALAAQFLNQQIFFHHFPGSEREGQRRLDALLARVRVERPGMTLVMSPIPSYQLVLGKPTDSVLTRAIGRLPMTFEDGVALEERLYQELRASATVAGWIFVDNLAALRDAGDPATLYNHFDYHIEPRASRIIAAQQAAVLRSLASTPAARISGGPPPRSLPPATR